MENRRTEKASVKLKWRLNMIRTFKTNKIRKVTELSDSLWRFSPCDGEFAGKVYPVTVPCCWESLPDFAAYRGVGVFTKEFQAKGNVRLVFKGVSHTARICVDGKEVGTHYNAYTPFSVEIRGLENGIHRLEVYADNRFSEESALHVPNDYMSYGGISRGVVLEELGEAYIEYLHAVPVREEEGWSVKTAVKVNSLSDKDLTGSLKLKLEGCEAAAENLTLKAGESTVVEKKIFAGDVEEWSMEVTRLYEISAELSLLLPDLSNGVDAGNSAWGAQSCPKDAAEGVVCDDLTERLGFREIKTEGKDILLNGKKLRIKGFCRHEDHPMFGCALPFAAIEQDYRLQRTWEPTPCVPPIIPTTSCFLICATSRGFWCGKKTMREGYPLNRCRTPILRDRRRTASGR